MKYRKSRSDYPAGVLGVYDNGGRTVDRFTVVYTPFTGAGRKGVELRGVAGGLSETCTARPEGG